MSLRTRLIVAFLLLSALPLAAIVLYSYASSIRSLREAAWRENSELAGEMSERMARVKEGVAGRLQRLRDLPLGQLAAEPRTTGDWQGLLSRVDAGLGEVAPFVEALEFVPTAGAIQPVAAVGPAPAAGAVPPPPPSAAEGSRLMIWLNREGEGEPHGGGTAEAAALRVNIAALEELLSQTARRSALAAVEAARRNAEAEVGRLARLMTPPVPAATPQPAAGARPPSPPAPAASPSWLATAAALAPPALPGVVEWEHGLEPAEREARKARDREDRRLLGRDFECPVESKGKKVGELRARISAKQLLMGVLALTRRDRGEIPFAIDDEGTVYAADPGDLETLEGLPLQAGAELNASGAAKDWAVVKVADDESGLTYGIARPLAESLRELRRTAGRNFAYGMGVVVLALVGIAPLSRRITRDLSALTAGAHELAQGNLEARVPVRSRDEVGHLAATFNQMAADLRDHQRRLLEEERLRKEHELERRLLEAENLRKTRELEDAREFQLSLLPKRVPDHPELEIAVYMTTATEVGGDYYDFHHAPDGTLTVAIGDATGHGARAGTLVTAIKSLFAAQAAAAELPVFLADANRAIRIMDLGRMAMALGLLRLAGGRLTFASAGMPGALVYRAAGGAVEEIAVEGLPLGSLADCPYRQEETDLRPGDTVLLMSDGFPELRSPEGEVQGYPRAEALFAAAAAKPAAEVVADLAAAVSIWKAGAPPDDDVTFVVLKARAA